MAEVINLFNLGYDHVICSACGDNRFHLKTFTDEGGVTHFDCIICISCGNQIGLYVTPVFPPDNE